jgi:hypothetical protein
VKFAGGQRVVVAPAAPVTFFGVMATDDPRGVASGRKKVGRRSEGRAWAPTTSSAAQQSKQLILSMFLRMAIQNLDRAGER